ncbi:MAG: hypothetical protein U1F33_04405 [Alphaproteobacteria bacterium]
MARAWRSKDEAELSGATLRALFDNEIPAIRIKGFASQDECRRFAEAVTDAEQHPIVFSSKTGEALSKPKIGYIGIFQHYYRHRDKSTYFADVPAASAQLRAIVARSFDPVTRMRDILRRHSGRPVDVADEGEGYGPYYAGIIRTMTIGADLHCDYHAYYARSYRIGRINAQIGWNIYASGRGVGGELIIYNNPWTPEVKGDEIPESFPLPRSTTEGAERHVVPITAGDVVLFNTRNPHEILPIKGDEPRISLGTFLGRLPDDNLLMWS